MCLTESCFLDYWKAPSLIPVFKNFGESSAAKIHHPVSILFVVSKNFEKLVNRWLFDHLQKCDIFSDFQYGFRSSHLTAYLLVVVSDRITRVFNGTTATRATSLGISKVLNRVWRAGLLHKLKSYGISYRVFSLILSFFRNRRLLICGNN